MATTKELNTLLSICEKDPEQFNSIVEQDKKELKHYCKELIQYGGTTITLAGGKVFTDDKLVKPARTVLKLFKHKKQTIVINHAFKAVLLEELNPYFNTEDSVKLNRLLNGEGISGRIVFAETQNKLASIFKQAIDENHISSSRKDVCNWIANWFNYAAQGKGSTKCSFKECLIVIDAEGKNEPEI